MKTYNPFIRRSAEIVEYARLHNLDIMDAADQFITLSHWHRTAELMRDYREYIRLCRDKSLDEVERITDDRDSD